MKILSICLPTFNQPEEVSRLLESLSSQISTDVEVILHDGSYTDDTKTVVDKYQKLIDIKYINLPGREVDLALVELIEFASGKYVWWVGDDDIAPDAIERILRVLKKYSNLSFMYIDPQIAETSLFHMDIPHDRFFISKNELLEKGGTALGFISSCLFNKNDLGENGLNESREYIGTLFVNLFIVLYVISKSEDLYYLKGPTVICYPNTVESLKKEHINDDGSITNNAFDVFGVNFHNIVMHFSSSYEKKTINKVIKKSFGMAWRGVLVAWAGGWDEPRGKRMKMMKYFYMFPEAWLALILFSLPSKMNKLMYSFYKHFKYKTFFR